jgi:hypothetical protein
MAKPENAAFDRNANEKGALFTIATCKRTVHLPAFKSTVAKIP